MKTPLPNAAFISLLVITMVMIVMLITMMVQYEPNEKIVMKISFTSAAVVAGVAAFFVKKYINQSSKAD